MLSSEPRLPQGASQSAEKLLEERPGVVRARRCLGVILDPEDRKLAMPEPFDRPVIQIHVSHLQFARPLYSPLVAFDRKTVILRRNKHPARFDFLHRVISSAMPVRHLRGRSPEGEPEKLVPQAN